MQQAVVACFLGAADAAEGIGDIMMRLSPVIYDSSRLASGAWG